MSIFASDHSKTIPVPSDEPHTVTIQRLPGRVVERAQSEHLSAFQGGRSPRGWAAIFQRSLTQGIATAAEAEKAIADPLAGYDRLTIVRGGLKAWSYVQGEGDKQTPKPVTPETIADLDDEALEYFAVEIMRLTKPGLFQTPAEREAARKND
jgi:hypothetical protein